MKVTAVFDIGKTNKKFFLFDQQYKEVYKEYIRIDDIKDDDGDWCDDLPKITQWIKTTLRKILNSNEFEVSALNFSTYGASLVHIDKEGKLVTPLYNYLKPYPKNILDDFYTKYGTELSLAKETASPPLQMLNSGLQLYYLKHAKPELYKKIRWSLHLPQYFSFLFTGIPLSEYTSIGCHTMLWDYSHNKYHKWVYEEQIDKQLPPIKETNTWIQKEIEGKKINIGIGIHDSSAALIPYRRADNSPFLLLSTGTWSISLNPFSEESLSDEDLQHDCLNFMQPSGKKVKAARLFLGNEYKIQLKQLCQAYNKESGYHLNIKFDKAIYAQLHEELKHHFKWESIPTRLAESSFEIFESFEEAYHQLMLELIQLQIQSSERAIGKTPISTLYIDGGFADNELFVNLLAMQFPNLNISTTSSPLGSALGAAMIISECSPSKNFLIENYKLKKIMA